MALNSSKIRSDFSVISSEYHVKATFKQILGRNAMNELTHEHNRRDELMGRKKKTVLNDSVLGGLLQYGSEARYYRHLHRVLDLMSGFKDMYGEVFGDDPDKGMEAAFWGAVHEEVGDYDFESIRGQQFKEESLLHRLLGEAGRAISRVTEKARTTAFVLEHYAFMDVGIIEGLTTGSTTYKVNSIRGIYTCLNLLHLH